jgi:hypothetical protein
MDKPVNNALVIQSHRTPLPYPWIADCLESVRDWCTLNVCAYRFMGDELFECVPDAILSKSLQQPVIASDLARLFVIQQALAEGFEQVIWLDADFLIFDAQAFVLPDTPFAVGREVWVQEDKQGRLKAYKKVHNALLMFRRENAFLEFYLDTAMRLLRQNTGAMPPQFVGPKLLTALHNVAMLPVMETAGMLSPCVIKDMLRGAGPALDLFLAKSPQAIAGANLCISSCDKNALTSTEMVQVITALSGGVYTS